MLGSYLRRVKAAISPSSGVVNKVNCNQKELAYVSGPTELPLLEETIYQKLEAISHCFPERKAIKSAHSQLNYKELHEHSDALAFGLLGLDINPGDRIAISLGNCVEYAVMSYASFKIGAIVVPLNPAYTPKQVTSALNHISAKCLVLSTEITLPYKQPNSTAPLLSEVLGDGITSSRTEVVTPIPSLRQIILVYNSGSRLSKSDYHFTAEYETLLSLNQGQKLPILPKVKNSDIATIQFTSGTTSTPKAACLTHRSILNNAYIVGRGMDLSELDVLCCPPPFYHCFGLVVGLLSTMTYGACITLPSEAFDARAVLECIKRDQPTTLYGVPTMFLAELELLSQGFLEPKDLKNMRTGVIGGSPIPASLRQILHEKFNLIDLANCYGLTESSPIICMTSASDDLEKKLHTVGKVLPHTAARITARDDATKVLKRGEKGELQISGYCVMNGYWQDEDRTSEALVVQNVEQGSEIFTQVWLRSGDEALIRQDGYIEITGRIKDIIIRGGENIYPPEVENVLHVLLQHPKISNASAVGLPDARYGEVVAAFIIVKDEFHVRKNHNDGKQVTENNGENSRLVVPALTEGDVKAWVQTRLNKMMTPRYVFWVDQMPLTASGKIEKYKLKESGTELLKAREAKGEL